MRVQMAGLAAVLSAALLSLSACGDDGAHASAGRKAAKTPTSAPRIEHDLRESNSASRVPLITDRAERWTSALGTFLDLGPTRGTWAVQGPAREWTWHFAPNPIRHEEVLAAQVKADGTIGEVSSVSRTRAPLFFFEAPSWMFFANYVVDGHPELDLLQGDVPTVRITWKPRASTGGLTGRAVWFSRANGAVLQIEDRSRTGHATRRVRRVLDSAIQFDPAESALNAQPCCPSLEHIAAHDMRRTEEAPFDVYEPTYLPDGYSRVRCNYTEQTIGDVADGSARTVHQVTQLFSDGVGIVSASLAPTDHMDAIARHYNRMPIRDGNADVCPTLTGQPDKILSARSKIRMRTDRCRTVLRHDGVAGVEGGLSVMVIGRNELPADVYIRMVRSLRKYKLVPLEELPVSRDPQPSPQAGQSGEAKPK